ncbi:hypothetical protein G6L63_11265 [Agrobacterium vitis]|uniref:hypothetical protein n=1 Tax=Agrobacterium vitis TaxID=373 RepID=UPI001573A21E|nr:hypothetical protein [Agrobacterium vitis]NSZ48489.1 hypothetical protein [Agrobacterium vitis]UJL73083.1 hypothetical protein AVCG412_09795 [Agrobacterium vitis]
MQRRQFLGLLSIGAIEGSAQSKLAKSIDDLEVAVRSAYGDVRLVVYADESERLPLLIKVLRA